MSECTAVVDYDENGGHEITCGEPAEFECCGEPRCHQCAHDWLDDLEPDQHLHEVRALRETPAQDDTKPAAEPEPGNLERGRYATITGISLRHGDRVKLLDYSAIDGKWYVEFFNGTIGRCAPDVLTPEPATEPEPRNPGSKVRCCGKPILFGQECSGCGRVAGH